jgi:two-component system, NtrC family, sensor kinase
MTLKMNRMLYALGATGLLAAFGVLFMQTRAVNFDAHNEIISSLRTLKQVDAEWNSDVLRTKTGLSSDYDRVASPLPLIESLKGTLASQSNSFWRDRSESNARLLKLLDVFSKLMDSKIALIEGFKTQNSILRNSSRFLPVAASELATAVRESSLAPTAKTDIDRALNSLLTNTMIYSITPDQALRERISAGTAQIGQLTAALPPEGGEQVETLVAHVGTVLRQQESSARLLAELSELPTAKAIDNLSDAQAQENEKLIGGLQIYRQALVFYSLFLLLLLGYAAWRVIRSYSTLNLANSALSDANHELKESQAHLVQAEKMSALGQMVAGIAHEINTPLAYVKGTFGVLHDQLSPIRELATRSHDFIQLMRAPERDNALLAAGLRHVEDSAKNIIDGGILHEMGVLLNDGVHGIEQISEIVLNLKNFSRLDRAKVSDFSVEAGLNSTLLLANHLLKNTVEIRKDYGGVPDINGSPSQINQVFLNIITNAVHAMPVRAEPNLITLRTSRENHDTVRVEIQDNGNGIPKDVLSKIFDPFFTTKPIGQGTGMGLSISYKIIHAHGGKLLVDTEPGVGTVFSILLPIRSVQLAVEAVVDDHLLAVA